MTRTEKTELSHFAKNEKNETKRFFTDFCGMIRCWQKQCHREERSDAAIRTPVERKTNKREVRIAARHKGERHDNQGEKQLIPQNSVKREQKRTFSLAWCREKSLFRST